MKFFLSLCLSILLACSFLSAQDSSKVYPDEFQSLRVKALLDLKQHNLLAGYEFNFSYYNRVRWAYAGFGTSVGKLNMVRDSFDYNLKDMLFFLSTVIPLAEREIANFVSADFGLALLLSDRLEVNGHEQVIPLTRRERLIAPTFRLGLGVSFNNGGFIVEFNYMKKQNQLIEDLNLQSNFWSLGVGVNL